MKQSSGHVDSYHLYRWEKRRVSVEHTHISSFTITHNAIMTTRMIPPLADSDPSSASTPITATLAIVRRVAHPFPLPETFTEVR